MISRIDRVIDVTRKHTELFLELLNVAYLTNDFHYVHVQSKSAWSSIENINKDSLSLESLC